MSDNRSKYFLKFQCEREMDTMAEFLNKIDLELTDEELMKRFKLLPHQVMDIKDVLRRSNL